MPTTPAAAPAPRPTAWPRAGLATLIGAAAMLGGGCANDAAQGPAKLEPSDFRAVATGPEGSTDQAGTPAPATTAAPEAEPAPGITPAARRQIRLMASSEASEGVLDVSVVPGPPRQSGAAPDVASGAVTLDSKVGEINGQPIIASKFLEPLDGRLRALALEHAGNAAAWRKQATIVIFQALELQIYDELLLAEAYASLSTEAREFGLRAFLTEIRENIARQNEGSSQLADERLREREGMTIDQKTKESLEKSLVAHELERRIKSRIHVSTRDQREYYDRNFAQFNPPGTARLRVILVNAADTDAVERVRAALEAEAPFADAARLEGNSFNRASGGEHAVTITGAYEEAEFFAIPELDNAAKALEPGMTIGPVEAGPNIAWVHLEEIDRPEGVSFYDAQLEIERHLINTLAAEERDRYFQKLLSRGSYSDITTTVERLLAIATERYFGTAAQ